MSTEKLTAQNKMKSLSEFPVMSERDSLKKTLDTMTQKRLGVACFVDKNGKLIARPLTEAEILEEAIADAFADFESGAVKTPSGLIQKLLEKMHQFFDAIKFLRRF